MSKLLRIVLVAVPVLFGLMTLVIGTKVVRGMDPGYTVFTPLLYFTIAMGAVYLGGGIAGALRPTWGLRAARAITLINAVVLVLIVLLLLSTQDLTARESVGAMTLRTGVWAALWWGWRRVVRRGTA